MRRTSVEIAAQLVSVTANLTFGQSAFLSDNKMIIIWMTAILCSARYLAKVVNFETDVYVWSSKLRHLVAGEENFHFGCLMLLRWCALCGDRNLKLLHMTDLLSMEKYQVWL